MTRPHPITAAWRRVYLIWIPLAFTGAALAVTQPPLNGPHLLALVVVSAALLGTLKDLRITQGVSES